MSVKAGQAQDYARLVPPAPHRSCRSGAPWASELASSVKPSASPSVVGIHHLPRYFRRSEPVSSDGGTGFCVPVRAVRGPLVKVLRASRGPDQAVGHCLYLVLISALSRINDCRQCCCVGVCPFGIGVVHGPSGAGRGIHGRIADGVRARRAVGAPAGFPRTGTDQVLRTARGRGRSAG